MALVATWGKRFKRTRGQKSGHTYQPGNETIIPGTMAFDSSYPAGGEAVTGFDAAAIKRVNIFPSGAYDFTYDHVNKKVVAWSTATGAEVAGTTDLSSLTSVEFELVLFK